MVDFPEYYEQMRPSLGSRDAPAPAAPAPRTETRQGDSPLTQRAALDPGFSDAPAIGPQRPAAPRRPAAASSETAEDLEQFQRDYLARLRAGPPQPARLSVLDMLRKRMEREMEGEDLRRIGEFGAGMLASGSPNFFTMLGSGARAAQRGDASRMDRLRQIAETERQQRALENEEASQRAEAEYRQRRLDVESPLREAQTEQARAYAEYLRRRGSGDGISERDIISIGNQARAFALREVPEPSATNAALDPPGAAETRRQRRTEIERTYIRAQYERLGLPPPANTPDVTAGPPAPAARIDARGNPIR